MPWKQSSTAPIPTHLLFAWDSQMWCEKLDMSCRWWAPAQPWVRMRNKALSFGKLDDGRSCRQSDTWSLMIHSLPHSSASLVCGIAGLPKGDLHSAQRSMSLQNWPKLVVLAGVHLPKGCCHCYQTDAPPLQVKIHSIFKLVVRGSVAFLVSLLSSKNKSTKKCYPLPMTCLGLKSASWKDFGNTLTVLLMSLTFQASCSVSKHQIAQQPLLPVLYRSLPLVQPFK